MIRITFQWHITDRCNSRCNHCYQEEFDGIEISRQSMKDIFDQFKMLLKEISRDRNEETRGLINITGGEPFIRDDFFDLLQIFDENRKEFSFGILTNGSLINSENIKILQSLKPGFVQVSIEGSKETHDNIRGQGDFIRVVKTIKLLVKHKIRTVISFTAHKGNYEEFKDVAYLGKKLKVARVWADRMIPIGVGNKCKDMMLSTNGTKQFFEIMYKEQKKAQRSWFCKTEIGMNRALQFLIAGGKPYHCSAGDSLITIMPNGDLYPCRRMPINIGNLLDTSLVELYFNSGLLKKLRDRSTICAGCEECFYSKLCGGGLRCLSFATLSSPFIVDPGCWLSKPNTQKC